MSLRLQINLIITALMLVFAALLVGLQIDNTRRSVHEEVTGANVVASQLLSPLRWVDDATGLAGMTDYLSRVGRLRANEITLYGQQGELIYRSPPSPYKIGREAPLWYARLVSSPLTPKNIMLPNGRIELRADPSRATLDGWDDLRPLLLTVFAGFIFGTALVHALIGRATRPLRQVVDGLQRMEQGAYDTRLPALSGREGRQISHAFNAMAQSVQEAALARQQARAATQALAENRELTQLIQTRIEQERGAIARELHDELGQQVTAIKSAGLAIVRRAAGSDALIERSGHLVVECADQIYDGVHRLISQLRPLALDRFGLHDALQDLLGDWRVYHPDMGLTLRTSGMLEGLDNALATAVYRIVQEAVNNALRHAQASCIDVSVVATDTHLQLDVMDNGRGRLEDLQATDHFGVLGMRERAQALGGSFELRQLEPSGVRIHVRLPVNRSANHPANHQQEVNSR